MSDKRIDAARAYAHAPAPGGKLTARHRGSLEMMDDVAGADTDRKQTGSYSRGSDGREEKPDGMEKTRQTR